MRMLNYIFTIVWSTDFRTSASLRVVEIVVFQSNPLSGVVIAVGQVPLQHIAPAGKCC
jgi:NADH:ubiquinone oxidoreductase subunit 3 (subunit A)